MAHITNIEKATLENENFRTVLYTAKHSQLVVMSILPGEEIGEETHHLDQFLRIESGEAKVILDGVESIIHTDDAVVVPAGTKHNFINISATEKLKLYSIYSPPEHKDGTVHVTRADAIADKHDHFEE